MIRFGAAAVAAAGGLAGLGYYLVVTGKATIDTGWGRRVRPLGPFGVQIAAPAATVFDVIAAPYLGRTPRAMAGKLQVLDRGTDMVLAEHYTPVHRGRLTAATLETVTFDRPRTIGFRLVRGPVPHLTEQFALSDDDGGHPAGVLRRARHRLRHRRPVVGRPGRGRLGGSRPVLLPGHPGRGRAPCQTRDRPVLRLLLPHLARQP
jgi:hypothetical protein